ncbi:hypothetical protein K458DRAFT_420358 [Lentithecium fluviatile CBS 122367]|uniref:Uncharacterized protein n=1 Tax=Lentithecium fluviatile CBS 122367 TaxID=1168545 RepID=A0A6G1IV65_9PLEO|nr:hypothetical protein K458DRAFT_420358 [Lentithecium fluviatile CBS 122367]
MSHSPSAHTSDAVPRTPASATPPSCPSPRGTRPTRLRPRTLPNTCYPSPSIEIDTEQDTNKGTPYRSHGALGFAHPRPNSPRIAPQPGAAAPST